MPDSRVDISVLIPAYHCALTIRRAVESALFQTGVRVEVCVWHDAGPVESWRAIERLADEYAGLISYSRNDFNEGPGAALQQAAKLARGRYFVMLGDDDWLEPGALAALAGALDAAPWATFAYGCTQYWGLRSDRHVPPPYARQDFYTSFPALYAYLYRREVWEASGGYRDELLADGRWLGAPDWDMALHCIRQGEGVALPDVTVLNHVLARGRMTEIVGRRGAAVIASMRVRHPELKAETI